MFLHMTYTHSLEPVHHLDLRLHVLNYKVARLLYTKHLQALHGILPQFSSRDEHGHLEQQDANECFSEIQRMLLNALSANKGMWLCYFYGGFVVAQSKKALTVACTTNRDSWFEFTALAKGASDPSMVGELVRDVFRKDKALNSSPAGYRF